MNLGQEKRLRLLESASSSGRKFFVFDDSCLGRPFDLEAAKEQPRREREMTEDDEVVVISWLGDGHGDNAA